MAKAKTKKKEIVDLKPKAEKITEAELAHLQSAIKTIDQLTAEVGSIEVRKHSLLKAMESVHSRLESQRVKLQETYGTDNINLQNGIITYPEIKPDLENGEVNKED
jgi:flagellin-like hook-associated protein FlgL